MIVIGDSVSIGYTPVVAQMLNTTIFVQHSPWAGGGGALSWCSTIDMRYSRTDDLDGCIRMSSWRHHRCT